MTTAHKNDERWVQRGDLIFHKGNRFCSGATGIVTEVRDFRQLGSTSVFISWVGEIPRDYNTRYGYSHVNIHNSYTTFAIVKANQ